MIRRRQTGLADASEHPLSDHGDDVTLAWGEAGRGQPLVRASNWLTHLEYDWESPVWRHWTRFLAERFRYDERGCGMSDWQVGELSFDSWVNDLSAVIDAAGVSERMILFGVSQGAAVAIAYAVAHPERVSHLVICGGYAVGPQGRADADHVRAYQAMQELARVGWSKSNPVFRQVFTSRFIPEGTEKQIGWFNELCVRTTTPVRTFIMAFSLVSYGVFLLVFLYLLAFLGNLPGTALADAFPVIERWVPYTIDAGRNPPSAMWALAVNAGLRWRHWPARA